MVARLLFVETSRRARPAALRTFAPPLEYNPNRPILRGMARRNLSPGPDKQKHTHGRPTDEPARGRRDQGCRPVEAALRGALSKNRRRLQSPLGAGVS